MRGIQMWNLYPCLYANKIIKKLRKMNTKTKTNKKTSTMAMAITAILLSTMIIGINGQNLQYIIGQTYSSGTIVNDEYKNKVSGTTNTTTTATAAIQVNPSKSTDKEFWINTVHLDGMTNINAGVKCDTCSQNTPLHPTEKPPISSTIPNGGGFVVTTPNKVGAWDFRSFTFAPDQIVVNQGDKVTLHFIGVQGAHHIITVDGVGTFPLLRGQIHTVSFVANSPGIINYTCHLHMPNMIGQILVLPKAM
jgi:plastocyanin